MTSSRRSFKENSFEKNFEMHEFPNNPLKKIIPAFDEISLVFQTVLESEARNLLPSVQLEFSCSLKMSDRQNDRFTRPSESLKISVSTICVS